MASIAIRTICKHAAASEPFDDQFGVGRIVDEVAWRCHLRAGLLARQIAAGVGCSRVKLQGL